LTEDGILVDKLSGQGVVEMTARGGVDEETESIGKIERGLVNNPESIWIHFSPSNESLGYPDNCVDFWRRTSSNEITWNRIIVREDFEEMKRIRSFLSGGEESISQNDLVRSPIESGLKLSELFDLFSLNERNNNCNLELIESVVGRYTDEFNINFGEDLTSNPDIVFRLYSACYKAIEKGRINSNILSQYQLELYMFGEMNRVVSVESGGCSVATTIGEFGEKIGYYVGSSGRVKFGEIPNGYKKCEECGCWYKGEKCPFC
jgi:hypothetical protein